MWWLLVKMADMMVSVGMVEIVDIVEIAEVVVVIGGGSRGSCY